MSLLAVFSFDFLSFKCLSGADAFDTVSPPHPFTLGTTQLLAQQGAKPWGGQHRSCFRLAGFGGPWARRFTERSPKKGT